VDQTGAGRHAHVAAVVGFAQTADNAGDVTAMAERIGVGVAAFLDKVHFHHGLQIDRVADAAVDDGDADVAADGGVHGSGGGPAGDAAGQTVGAGDGGRMDVKVHRHSGDIEAIGNAIEIARI